MRKKISFRAGKHQWMAWMVIWALCAVLVISTGVLAATTTADDAVDAASSAAEETKTPTVRVAASQRIQSITQLDVAVIIEGHVVRSVQAASVELREGGIVGGNVDVSPAGSVHINGRVTGNVIGKDITLGPKAVVGGSIVHLGGQLIIDPAASYQAIGDVPSQDSSRYNYSVNYSGPGRIVVEQRPLPLTNPPIYIPVPRRTLPERIFTTFFLCVGFLLGAISILALCLIFFSRTTEEAANTAEQEPGRALLTGFIGLLLLPLIALLLAVTIIGIPLLPVLCAVFLLALVVGFASQSVFLGRKMKQLLSVTWISTIYREGAIGMLALLALLCVPVVGWLILLIITVLGYGAVLLYWYPIWRERWQQRRIAKEPR